MKCTGACASYVDFSSNFFHDWRYYVRGSRTTFQWHVSTTVGGAAVRTSNKPFNVRYKRGAASVNAP